MRAFTELEIRNMEFLVNKSVQFTQLQITGTGKGKKCPDATLPMRLFFKEQGIYDYDIYDKEHWGDASKRKAITHIITEEEDYKTETSFNRARTCGDRRYNISGLPKFSEDNDIHVIFCIEKELVVINITRIDIEYVYNSSIINPVKEYIDAIYNDSNLIAKELLSKLRELSYNWYPTIGSGNTAVGRTVEHLLGLGYNSKPIPDYKGIELKSKRIDCKGAMYTMFGSFPDWEISKMNRETLIQEYGHIYHDGIRRVFSTTARHTPNSDNFFLDIDLRSDLLELKKQANPIKDIVAWKLERIHNALLTKHKETFWIDVYSEMRGDHEFMKLKKADHTKSPNIGQFDTLLEKDIIYMDVVIGRQKVNAQGKITGNDNWNFRIAKNNRDLLFPQVATYNLG